MGCQKPYNRGRTDIAMSKRATRQMMIYQTLNRKVNIKNTNPTKSPGKGEEYKGRKFLLYWWHPSVVHILILVVIHE